MTNTKTTAQAASSAISTFDFRGFNLRCILIEDQPWFAATDVCEALGIVNTSHATSKLALNELSRRKLSTAARARPNNMVSEQGLYKLIFQSRKPEAKDFQDWVFGTVLPAIRKDGGYIEHEEKVVTGEMDEDELVLKAIEVMKRKIDRISAERDALHEELYHVTVAEYVALNHIYLTQSQKSQLSVRARKLTLAAGEEVVKTPRVVPVRGKMINTSVNVYKRDVLDKAAAELKLFDKAQGTARPITQAA